VEKNWPFIGCNYSRKARNIGEYIIRFVKITFINFAEKRMSDGLSS
jgi:hypothetical protein